MSGTPGRSAAAGLIALAVAMGIGRFAFTPILPMMLAEGLDLAGGSMLATANYVGYLVGALASARMHASPRAVIRGSLFAVAASTLAMAWFDSLAAGMALRFVAGVTSAWVLVFASAWGLERIQACEAAATRATLAAMLYSGVGTGILVAGIACGLLRGLGAATAWTVLGLAALGVALALRGVGGDSAMHPSAGGRPAGQWRLVACYGGFGFAYIVPATYLPAQAQALLGPGFVQSAAWPLFGLAAAASVFLAARWGPTHPPRTIWIAAQLAMALGVALPAASDHAAALAASALLVGGTFMVVTMAGMQEARRVAGAAARPLMGAMTAAFAAGQVAGPVLVGALARTSFAFTLPLLLATLLLVASSAALAIPSPSRSNP